MSGGASVRQRPTGYLCKAASVRIIRYSHSCVRLELDGGMSLVIDPGIWSEPAALRGADAILVTHEHVDHVDALRLAGLGAPVFAPAAAHIRGLNVHGVTAGQEFDAGGFSVRAIGGRHAAVHPGQATCANLGYLVEDTLYHPGDALHVPLEPVETLLVPLQGAWLKTSEAIHFVQAIAPDRAFGIHDAQVNERGLTSLNGWLEDQGGTHYQWLQPGTTAP